MKKIELECNNCGAIMQLSNDKSEAFCPYCKNKILIEKAPTLEELTIREEKISYAKRTGENKAEEEFEIRKKKKRRKTAIIICLSFVLFISIVIAVNYYSLEPMDDPFKCIDVKFVGSDENGSLEIVDNKSCSNYSDIKFTVSKGRKLKEEEKVTITATSDKYRFDKSTREYTVSGLSLYLKNLDNLSEKLLEKLHNTSTDFLKNRALGISFKGELVNLYPHKLYLYTNEKNDNILYDVFKAEIKTSGGNIYEKYLVASYTNFIILNNDQLFSYSELNKCGNNIKAGDPNEYSAFSNEYAGLLNGFLSITDFENYISKNNDGTFKIIQK